MSYADDFSLATASQEQKAALLKAEGKALPSKPALSTLQIAGGVFVGMWAFAITAGIVYHFIR